VRLPMQGHWADMATNPRDVCYWPIADIPLCTAHVRFRG
jgi:hypothetical protein